MLGKGSEEGNLPGLGWLDMQVKRFPSSLGLHIPHMGWREVVSRQPSHELLTDFDNNARFYFVHSYYMQPTNPDLTLLECQYGIEFSAAVANTHIMGVQFHPEKSHRFGKKLLTNFARMTMK
jgi:glutamine amidotransferase